MSAGRPSVTESGTTIHAETLDMIEWLQECIDKLEAGREHEIPSNPFYVPRSGPLTDETVDEVIKELDAKFDYEIDNYPLYHLRRSDATDKTEFHRLGRTARRGLVEGLLRIIEEHEDWEERANPKKPTVPSAPSGDYMVGINGGPPYSGGC